jgi:hypothetical protein
VCVWVRLRVVTYTLHMHARYMHVTVGVMSHIRLSLGDVIIYCLLELNMLCLNVIISVLYIVYWISVLCVVITSNEFQMHSRDR